MRRVLKILFALMVLVVVAGAAAFFLIPRERIVQLAADQVREATGRELVMSSDISPAFWPVLGVRTGSVRLSNAEWGEAADMISASAVEIGVELVPLFAGEINVTTLRLVDPVVVLEIDRNGRGNWVFDDGAGASSSGGAGGGGLPRISLPVASVKNGHVSFRDARSGQRVEIAQLDLNASIRNMQSPLTLEGSGLWNGKRARFDAVIDTPAGLAAGRRTAVTLNVDGEPAKIGFDGSVELADGAAVPAVEGKLSARLPSPPGALAWATGTQPPPGLDQIGAVALDAAVTASDAALSLTAAGTAEYRGRSLAYSMTASGDRGWIDRNAYNVSLGARTEGLFELSFSGPVAAGAAPSAEGPVKLVATDLRGLAKWLGGADLPAPEGTLRSAALDAQLSMKGGDRIALSGLEVRMDGTLMTGEARVDLGGARPMVAARLESGPIDMSPFMAPSGSGAGGGDAADAGWSTEPIDVSALTAVDADVAIRAEAVDLGDIEIGRTDIDARLRDGRLDMDIRRVDAYGGGMNGTVAVVAGDGAAVAADVTVSQVQLRPLLTALAGLDNLEGLGAFRIKAEGRGRSMDALMRSLDGQGGLELTDGAIYGLNLAEIVRNITGRGGGGVQKTDFSAITGTFDITDGVLHNSDFSLLGPLIRVIGAGTVDLGNRRQDFRLEPKAVANLTGQGGSLGDAGLGIFPVKVTGTWANPVIRPDLTAAVTGLMTDPKGTVDAVTGIVKGGSAKEAAGALLGGLTGRAGGASAGATAGSESGTQGQAAGIGGVLGGLLGGGGTQGGQQDTGIGGLLGALGGKSKRDGGTAGGGSGTGSPAGGDATAALPPATGDTAAGGQAAGGTAESGELAPLEAPLPRPAPPDRAARAAAVEPPEADAASDLPQQGGAEGQPPAGAAAPSDTQAGSGTAEPAPDPVQEGQKLLNQLLNVLPKN